MLSKVEIFCTQAYTKVFQYNMAYGGNYLKSILTYLLSNKFNEINVYHWNTQRHTPYKHNLIVQIFCIEAPKIFSDA